MFEEGLKKESILEELEGRLGADLSYDSGVILGSMCTKPHPLANRVFMDYIEKNLFDPGLYPETQKLEIEVVKMMGSLLSNPCASGHIVSGGTEANLTALWAARDLSGKSEVVIPASAHISLRRASNLLGLKFITVRLNESFQVDIREVEKRVNSNTAAIVGTAGTTELGVVDPIKELSDIAVDHGVYLHVDAAFGGFVLPFLSELGYEAPMFDFRLPGVRSIVVDPHKMGLAPIPAGGILFRDSTVVETISETIPYLAGGEAEHSTVTGTRSGASAIAVWAVLKHLGRKGYRALVKRCMELTKRLAEGIQQINGLELVVKPTMNIVGIKSDDVDILSIARGLRVRGWAISLFPRHIRIVVMPHTEGNHLETFLEDLKKATSQNR